MKLLTLHALALLVALAAPLRAADGTTTAVVAQKLAADYPSLLALYSDLHAHPELSLME